jgi:hypothetical protein
MVFFAAICAPLFSPYNVHHQPAFVSTPTGMLVEPSAGGQLNWLQVF